MIRRAIPFLAAFSLLAAPAWVLSAAPAWAKSHKPAKAAKVSPITVASLLSKAHDALEKGDTALALRMTQAAIVADPARPDSYVALGDIYAGMGQADYARSYYGEALEIDPSAASALKATAALDSKHPGATAQAGP